jgi:release factor glutamine methyltransferase
MADAATLAVVLAAARRRLAAGGIDDPALEARMIVEHFTGTGRRDAIASPERAVSADQLAAIEDALARRLAHEPVHRIFGFRDFYGLRLRLSPDTLEPRPDTETLVDAVLPLLRAMAGRAGSSDLEIDPLSVSPSTLRQAQGSGSAPLPRSTGKRKGASLAFPLPLPEGEVVREANRSGGGYPNPIRVLDLGTGTGAVALAIAAQVPEAVVTASDVSAGALATAAGNAVALGLRDRFIPLQSDWFSAVGEKFHAIVSNPPYIRSEAIDGLQPEVRLHDPRRALDGGADGLDAYRAIALGAAEHLEDGGIVGLEIGNSQGRQVRRIFEKAGYKLVSSHRDLAGTERALIFCR